MWGKWAQIQNKTKTTIVGLEKEFYELLRIPGSEVTNLIFSNDDVAWVSQKYSEDNVAAYKNINLAVAAYVTPQSRLKVYKYLSELGQSVLYWDTDSVVFLEKYNEPQKVKTGDYLGEFTNQLEEYDPGSFIEEFVRWRKNYAFSVFCPSTGKRSTKCKVKGITFNYENSKVVNFTALKNMILENAAPVHVHNPKKMKRKQGGVIVSEPETKE